MFTSGMLIIVICLLLYYVLLYYRRQLPFLRAGNALPGPIAYPIIGNTYYYFNRSFDDFLNDICSLVDVYPPLFRFWLGHKLLISVSEPDHIKTILRSKSCLDKGVMYNVFKAWAGTGILVAPASIWVKHRKIIAPSFNANVLRAFCDTFVEQALILVDKLEHMVGDEIDLYRYVTTYSLDIIYSTSLGMQLETQSNHDHPYIKALDKLKEIVMHRIRNIFLLSDTIFKFTFLNREQRKHLNIINSSAEKVIQKRKNARNNLDSTEDKCAEPESRILLDILMDASDEGQKFTRQNILDHINTICSAATDSTGIAINFTTFMLANFPEVQEKVYEELVEIYGTQDPKSAPVQFNDLKHMNYLERVIKETLRLFPVAPFIGRRLSEDLKIGGHTLPKGVDIIISILSTHRNEKYWPNALKFDPDRFLPENMKNIHPYCYLPFSNGPRNCIGIGYAMMSMKIIIATLLRTYILKVDKKVDINKIKLKIKMTLEPIDPFKVRIEERR